MDSDDDLCINLRASISGTASISVHKTIAASTLLAGVQTRGKQNRNVFYKTIQLFDIKIW